MKSHRQYVKEQIKRDPRLAVMIARLREKRGWSQRDLAKVTGIKQPQIARIEMGGQMPTLDTLWRLADALKARVVIGPDQYLEIKAA